MQSVHIDYRGADHGFEAASLLAKDATKENKMKDPTLLAWHQNSKLGTTPYYDNANLDTWWEKYGAGNGGRLEISVRNSSVPRQEACALCVTGHRDLLLL
jgi:hypothetical protein